MFSWTCYFPTDISAIFYKPALTGDDTSKLSVLSADDIYYSIPTTSTKSENSKVAMMLYYCCWLSMHPKRPELASQRGRT